jgi:hypothetical protein
MELFIIKYLYFMCTFSIIEENEMGGACSAYGGEDMYIGFWWGNLSKGDRWGEPDVDGRIILRWIFRNWGVGYGLD